MDIENIPLGIDFRTHFQSLLQQADVLLVLIGEHWIGAGAGTSGGARIHNEADPVRREIEVAIEREMPLIPVLIDGASMPGQADLPASLEALAYLNAAEVATGRDFNSQMDRLIAAIDRIAPVRSAAVAVPAAEEAKPEPGMACEPEPAPRAPRAPSWPNELVLYFLVPLVVLLVAHHLIVNSLDLNAQYLRIVSFTVPLVFGFLRSWRGGRGAGSAFIFALALGLLGVAAMTTSEGLNSGQPIMPQTRAEWRENVEYALTIALSFMIGHAVASGLNGKRRRNFRAIKGTKAHGPG